LADDPANLKIYLAILRDTAQKRWAGSPERDLIVIFPPETRDQVEWLLRVTDRDEERR
jgi:hypothetical protein